MVQPKKHLGQHFLIDLSISKKISETISDTTNNVLEIGPGTGVLTQFLMGNGLNLKVIELDTESVNYLRNHFSELEGRILEHDFLKINLEDIFKDNFQIIGNFPYNISTQIMFKVIENKDKVLHFSGMFQKEVAERICASSGSKKYGILSVLTQAYFNAEYLFTVPPNAFNPPPKVESGVLKMRRLENQEIGVSYGKLKAVVKMAFHHRRKMIRNSLKAILPDNFELTDMLTLRPEQISVADFIRLTKAIYPV